MHDVGDIARVQEQVERADAISAQLAPPSMTREPLVAADMLRIAELDQSMTSMTLEDAIRGRHSSDVVEDLRADTMRISSQLDIYREFDSLDRQHTSVDARNMAAKELYDRRTARLQANVRSLAKTAFDGQQSALRQIALAYNIRSSEPAPPAHHGSHRTTIANSGGVI